MKQSEQIRAELEACINPVKREYLPRFFKTGKGEYGEGDRFLGVVVPDTRRVARRHKDAPFGVMAELLQSEWHECRLCALLMMVERFRKAGPAGQQAVFDFYLTQTARINNWDLVDLSAPYIVGEYLKDRPRDVLYRLAESDCLWERRIAVVATFALIRRNDFADILRLTEYFLHPYASAAPSLPAPRMHDLMQKALGWMLREMGKRDKGLLVQLLSRYAAVMPRTMLHYAVEKFPDDERREFMGRR